MLDRFLACNLRSSVRFPFEMFQDHDSFVSEKLVKVSEKCRYHDRPIETAKNYVSSCLIFHLNDSNCSYEVDSSFEIN